MGARSRRERLRARRRRQQIQSRLIIGAIILAVTGAIGFLVWNAVRPAVGEEVALMANAREHIPNSQAPTYNSDPPTNGPHYLEPLPAGFYEEADLSALPEHPEGHIVHSQEHGYVIFWYNCAVLDEAGCQTLKNQVRELMDEFNSVKLIAFPWDSIDEPLVMTSWGRMHRFADLDEDLARRFIRVNRNRAPEPNAP